MGLPARLLALAEKLGELEEISGRLQRGSNRAALLWVLKTDTVVPEPTPCGCGGAKQQNPAPEGAGAHSLAV